MAYPEQTSWRECFSSRKKCVHNVRSNLPSLQCAIFNILSRPRRSIKKESKDTTIQCLRITKPPMLRHLSSCRVFLNNPTSCHYRRFRCSRSTSKRSSDELFTARTGRLESFILSRPGFTTDLISLARPDLPDDLVIPRDGFTTVEGHIITVPL